MANVEKIRTGELRVAVEEEKALWCDRKRWLLFGLAWTFTKYILTASRLYIQTGFLNRHEEEIRLYRITDVSLSQSFGERLVGVGTLHLCSSDPSCPELYLKHVKQPRKVKEVFSQCIETARRENGVRTSELVNGHHPGDGHEHHSFGPEVVPDENGNGIDDREE